MISQIYEGWKNNLLPPKKLKELIKQTSAQRLEVCNNCDYHSDNRKNYKTVRPDKHCTHCGCTLSAKTKCLSCACPLNKWEALISSEEEEQINKDGK